VELVAASALAVIMAVAISGVLRSMQIQRKAILDGKSLTTPWQQPLLRQLQWDLASARVMVTRPGRLRLLGFGGHDRVSKEATHRLTEVVYAIHDVGGRSCLIRQERPLGGQGGNPTVKELAGVGITGIVLMGREDMGDEYGTAWIDSLRTKEGTNKQREQGARDEWVPVPKIFRLVLSGVEQRPVIDQMIVL